MYSNMLASFKVRAVGRFMPGRARLIVALWVAAALACLGATIASAPRGSRPLMENPRPASPLADAPASAPATQGKTVTVNMTKDMTFSPDHLTITAGTTVVWKNPSGDTHTVTADPKKASDAKHVALPEGVQPFDSGSIAPGKTYSYTFTVPGTYKYVCLPHEDMGMLGQIEVKSEK